MGFGNGKLQFVFVSDGNNVTPIQPGSYKNIRWMEWSGLGTELDWKCLTLKLVYLDIERYEVTHLNGVEVCVGYICEVLRSMDGLNHTRKVMAHDQVLFCRLWMQICKALVYANLSRSKLQVRLFFLWQ